MQRALGRIATAALAVALFASSAFADKVINWSVTEEGGSIIDHGIQVVADGQVASAVEDIVAENHDRGSLHILVDDARD